MDTPGVEPSTSASAAPALTTLGRTVVVGLPDAAQGDYCRLSYGPPEPHLIRDDLSQLAPPVSFALTSFAQLTDLHITDDQSPLRAEFLDSYADPGAPHQASYPFDSAYRAHECLTAQVLDAMCRALRSVGRGPRTGLPLAFTMISGDAIDNCQFNEVRRYIDILDGTTVIPNSGSPTLDHSVTSDALGLAVDYWHPADRDFELANHNGPGLDKFFRAGFPEVKQLPFAARRPFSPTGLGMPWFTCYGNHDALVQGNLTIDGDYEGHAVGDVIGLDLREIAVGDFKRTQLAQTLPDVKPSGWDVGHWTDLIDAIVHAAHFAGLIVPADSDRRVLTRQEFIAAHFDTQGTPLGHGFGAGDRAYYVMSGDPSDGVRHIVLDTTRTDGGDTGVIDWQQLQWLENVLLAGSSRYLSDNLQPVVVEQPGVRDVLFVIHAHHALRSLDVNAGDLERLLLRFPNVILLVNGHSHRNVITPHWRPWPGWSGGFWEVGTSSLVDWPVQGRLFDLTVGGGVISIFTTMIDIDAPLDFRTGAIADPAVLASLSRELAANDLQERGRGVVEHPGAPTDRNVRLLLPAPFGLPDPPQVGSPLAAADSAVGGVLAAADDQDHVRIGDPLAVPPSWSALDGTLRAICLESGPDGTLDLLGVNAGRGLAPAPLDRRGVVALALGAGSVHRRGRSTQRPGSDRVLRPRRSAPTVWSR